MTAKTEALHPKGATLACPLCDQRLELAVPAVGAFCANNHRAATMRPVPEIDSRDTGEAAT